MSRWFAPLLFAFASAIGCSGTPAPAAPSHQMASTEPQAAKPPPVPPPAPAPPPGKENDGIAARINNEILTWKDVKDALKEIRPQDLSPELLKSKRREMAEQKLFLQSARANNLSVSELELDEAQRRDVRRYGGEEDFDKVVRIKWGTRTAYREDTRKEILVSKLYRFLLNKAWTNPGRESPGLMRDFVTPEEIREFYEKHQEQFQLIERISFMRIAFQFSTPREEEIKVSIAESLVRKLAEGAEFSMLAFFYSDVTRAKNFRDLGVTRKDLEGFYTPQTVTYLFDTLKEGQVSPIVKDGRTLNIFKMEQKVNQRAETFEEAQMKIRNMIENQYRVENRKKLRDHLVKDAYIWPADLFEND